MWSGPEPADVVVEVTGSPAGFALARAVVRPVGTLALKSTFAGTLPADFDASVRVVDEITLVGSRCGPFAPALELLRRNGVEPRPLIRPPIGWRRVWRRWPLQRNGAC